ncbi:MAG: winged helix-turn-helix transcriptional regulator [Candidatus Thorarchaeota archaeon]
MEDQPRIRSEVEGCPVFITSQILGKRWTILVLQTLMTTRASNGLRFNELQKDLSWISPKVLTQRLRELEAEGILNRFVDAKNIPPKVTYQLTQKGESLRIVLTHMQQWGMEHGGSKTEQCLGNGFSQCQGCRGTGNAVS